MRKPWGTPLVFAIGVEVSGAGAGAVIGVEVHLWCSVFG